MLCDFQLSGSKIEEKVYCKDDQLEQRFNDVLETCTDLGLGVNEVS